MPTRMVWCTVQNTSTMDSTSGAHAARPHSAILPAILAAKAVSKLAHKNAGFTGISRRWPGRMIIDGLRSYGPYVPPQEAGAGAAPTAP